jgi:DNA-binding protein
MAEEQSDLNKVLEAGKKEQKSEEKVSTEEDTKEEAAKEEETQDEETKEEEQQEEAAKPEETKEEEPQEEAAKPEETKEEETPEEPVKEEPAKPEEPKKPEPKKQPERKARKGAARNVVFVGKKPTMSYVLAVVTQFSDGINDVHIKARGRSISRAVDVAEVVKNRFVQGVKVDVQIGTDEVTDENNNKINVSTIDVVLNK